MFPPGCVSLPSLFIQRKEYWANIKTGGDTVHTTKINTGWASNSNSVIWASPVGQNPPAEAAVKAPTESESALGAPQKQETPARQWWAQACKAELEAAGHTGLSWAVGGQSRLFWSPGKDGFQMTFSALTSLACPVGDWAGPASQKTAPVDGAQTTPRHGKACFRQRQLWEWGSLLPPLLSLRWAVPQLGHGVMAADISCGHQPSATGNNNSRWIPEKW